MNIVPDYIVSKFGRMDDGVIVPSEKLQILKSEKDGIYRQILEKILQHGRFETIQEWSVLAIPRNKFTYFEKEIHLAEAFALIRTFSFEFIGYRVFLEIAAKHFDIEISDDFLRSAKINQGKFVFRDLCWLFGNHTWNQSQNNLWYLSFPHPRYRRLSLFVDLMNHLPRKARFLRNADVSHSSIWKDIIKAESIRPNEEIWGMSDLLLKVSLGLC